MIDERHPIFSCYQRVVLSYPRAMLLILLAALLAMLSQLPQLRLDASADALVLEGDADLAYYREISERYQSEDFLVVTYRPLQGALFDTPTLNRIGQLRDQLSQLPGVASVVSLLDLPLLQSPPIALSDLGSGGFPTLLDERVDRAMAQEEFRTSPLYRNLLTNQDGTVTALQVNLVRDQRYFELLEQREQLRRDLQANPQALHQAEQVFDQYRAQAADQQAVLVASVRALLEPYRDQAEIFLGGVPMIAVDMMSFVKSDLVVFGSAIVVFIIAIMGLIFRRWRWVWLPLCCCLVTAGAMLGLLALMDWRMTVISSNFVALLLIINLSLTIHLVVRYRELQLLMPSAPTPELVSAMVRSMFLPCLYTVLTTVVAFASLVVSGIRPVIDFGWMMTCGVLMALVVSFWLLPTVLLLMSPVKPPQEAATEVAHSLRFARLAERYGRLILWISLLLTAAAVIGISRLQVENRFIDYFKPHTEIYQGMRVIDQQLGGTIPLELILRGQSRVAPTLQLSLPATAAAADALGEDAFWEEESSSFGGGDTATEDEFDAGPDDFADPAAATLPMVRSDWLTRSGLERIRTLHHYLEAQPEIGKVLSLATFYELLEQVLGKGVDDIQLAFARQQLPPSIWAILVDPYLDETQNEARLVMRVMETSESLRRAELLARIDQTLQTDLGFAPEESRLTGMLVLYNNMLQSLFRSQILTLGAVFIAITAMFVVLFRSLSLALIAVAPNMLAASVVLGGMGVVGLPLDMMTITIAAITIGIGVDDTIHYVHRFRQEFARDRNYLATMYRCHGSIGRAMYYTSVIVIVGFAILTLSNFVPSMLFGLLTGAAMLAALMGALLLLPRLLLWLKPLGPEGDAPVAESRC